MKPDEEGKRKNVKEEKEKGGRDTVTSQSEKGLLPICAYVDATSSF